MKKIGILTHYYNTKNLGGLLQAYALVNVLCGHQYRAEQISFQFQTYDSISFPIYSKLHTKHISIKQMLFNLYHWFHKHLILKWLYSRLSQQDKSIIRFANEIAHSTTIYNDQNIKQANQAYDIVITGSDQVWNLDQLPHCAFYGEFASPNKKVISYAASAGTNQFSPLAEKLFIQKLARLNAISVREKTLKEYIERITPYKATVVLDPTFLLSPAEWLQIANSAPVPQKPYIFCYFLGGKSTWQRKIAQAYADKYGYEVVHLPYIMQSIRPADRFLKGQGRYDVGPREFIALINGAQCVFTDSFHGLAFSINFGKNFYVFNRDDKSGPQSMNARITDTLATFSLTERHITDKKAALDNAPLDFTHAHEVLAQEKQKSINWLLNALKN